MARAREMPARILVADECRRGRRHGKPEARSTPGDDTLSGR
jgi:hypothetical protein